MLRLGFIPLAETEELRADLDAFAAALGDALGLKLWPLFAPNYGSLLRSLEEGIAQIAWVPPLLAARAVTSGKVVPTAVAVRGGASVFSSVLFAKRGTALKGPSYLSGARVAWVDPESAGGYILMSAHLKSLGIDPQVAFADQQFLRTHEAVARAVAEGRADVGATYLTRQVGTETIASVGWRTVGEDDAFDVLDEVKDIPADFLGVHKALAPRVAEFQASLIGDDRVEKLAARIFQTEGFARPTAEYLEALNKLFGSHGGIKQSAAH
jgi:phosphonate transport system substrate-binding protein